MTVPHHPNEAHTNLKVAKHFRCLSSYQYTCNIPDIAEILFKVGFNAIPPPPHMGGDIIIK
jgi:hypothetical protein